MLNRPAWSIAAGRPQSRCLFCFLLLLLKMPQQTLNAVQWARQHPKLPHPVRDLPDLDLFDPPETTLQLAS